MSTRKIKDAKDLSSGELIYFRGHAKSTFMSDGRTVEDAINNVGGGSSTNTSEIIEISDEIVSFGGPNMGMLPNVTYVATKSITGIEFLSEMMDGTDGFEHESVVDKYILHFIPLGGHEILMSSPQFYWANGTAPNFVPNVPHELSITCTTISRTRYYSAVLTPFKKVN